MNVLLIIFTLVSTAFAIYFYVKERRMKAHLEHLERRLILCDSNLDGKAKYSELGLMSAGIAHEINNPLSIVISKATYLMRIFRDPERKKELAAGLQQILYTSERMVRTIQGIRDYIYKDEHSYEEEISLKSIMENVMVFCGQRLFNHGIELRLIGIDEVAVKGHRVQLEQAFLNLINNAFDAVDNLEQKWIEISALESQEYIEIYFKDSGHGIPEELQDKIMEPFFSTKGSKGTGLGLALIKGIADQHLGSFSYVKRSTNTTFLLELPKSGEGRVRASSEQESSVYH